MEVEDLYKQFIKTHPYPKWRRRGEKREKEREKRSGIKR